MVRMLTIDGLGLAEGLDQLVTLLPRLARRGGLSLVAASTLATLERRGPSRVTELADAQSVTQPAMTGLVSRLVAQALVERSPDPDDRRGVLVALTAEGRALLAARRRERAEALAAMLGDLASDDRAALAAALPALTRLVMKGQRMTSPTNTSAPKPAAASVEEDLA
jgi:DNA-binding MarR family transcriptional regulator